MHVDTGLIHHPDACDEVDIAVLKGRLVLGHAKCQMAFGVAADFGADCRPFFFQQSQPLFGIPVGVDVYFR